MMVATGNREQQPLNLTGVDPETCMMVFQNHWAQVEKILEKHDPLRVARGRRLGPIPGDEASAVQNYVEHMLFLLMEECGGPGGTMGPILELVVTENVMERLFIWSLQCEFTDDMKLEQLRTYEMLVRRCRQPLLRHKPVLRPLMMLLASCSGPGAAAAVEAQLLLLLGRLCSILAREPSILELFFHASEDQGAANFLIFSLLIPFTHREGAVGRQAREALLFIAALSAENRLVARYIVENTYFCPVLATGLSGLYSSLPARLEVCTEDWHWLEPQDCFALPALVQFLNSLEFCDSVIQVAHPLIRSQLVSYIYNGFLVPVVAPALHKPTLEEVVTTTGYLELFLRRAKQPALLRTFLHFILLHRHEGVHVLDILVCRINTPFQLGTVSLALFRTLLGLHCEDVMLQLVLRYLIPCSHITLSQRGALKERDCYSVSAARFLALTPSCCLPEPSAPWCAGGPEEHEGLYEEHHGADVGFDVPEILTVASYLQYLRDAHDGVRRCVEACHTWSALYDGEDPPPELCGASVMEERDGGLLRTSHELPIPPEQAEQLELEWDDSFDTVPCPDCTEAPLSGRPALTEPPRHIQEMRRSAIMLIRGSYIEESEFQDDVMVYSLVAQKDVQEATDGWWAGRASPGEERERERPAQSLTNGCSPLLDTQEAAEQDHCPPGQKSGQAATARRPADEPASQYEQLIHELGAELGSPEGPWGETLACDILTNEDGVDFSSFSTNDPESENTPSPYVSKAESQPAPFTGPFVSVLLSRLENMLENSLHTNLLLTGLLAQLAVHPQPLLRRFLLDAGPSPSSQPTTHSLYQVLASIKSQIDHQASMKQNFREEVREAQKYLLAREEVPGGQDTLLKSHTGQRGLWPPIRNAPALALQPRVPLQAQNAALATVIYAEFLKELAAIAQEHSVLEPLPSDH
ncbi:FHF complex subunit HOOK-interacting protein 1A-like [Paramormyrops kingsleyae]|uniref:FHF complex subunit HOOK-interacting protein 1A-like n=1 Tax=Paramormyrops kingsleyae TaxID=1676925 RepID=UPI003B974DCF